MDKIGLAVTLFVGFSLGGCANYIVVAAEPRYAGQPHDQNVTALPGSLNNLPCPLQPADRTEGQPLLSEDDPSCPVRPESVNANSVAWSAVSMPHPGVTAGDCGDGEQLAMVRISRNFGEGLITILTLGFVSPVTVHYYCASPSPASTGEFNTGGAGE